MSSKPEKTEKLIPGPSSRHGNRCDYREIECINAKCNVV